MRTLKHIKVTQRIGTLHTLKYDAKSLIVNNVIIENHCVTVVLNWSLLDIQHFKLHTTHFVLSNTVFPRDYAALDVTLPLTISRPRRYVVTS